MEICEPVNIKCNVIVNLFADLLFLVFVRRGSYVYSVYQPLNRMPHTKWASDKDLRVCYAYVWHANLMVLWAFVVWHYKLVPNDVTRKFNRFLFSCLFLCLTKADYITCVLIQRAVAPKTCAKNKMPTRTLTSHAIADGGCQSSRTAIKME